MEAAQLEGLRLFWTAVPVAQATVRIRPPTQTCRGAIFPSTGVNPNAQALSLGGDKNRHACLLPPTIGSSRVEESPAPLQKAASRALATRGGEADCV